MIEEIRQIRSSKGEALEILNYLARYAKPHAEVKEIAKRGANWLQPAKRHLEKIQRELTVTPK